jgi:hypothetical protein
LRSISRASFSISSTTRRWRDPPFDFGRVAAQSAKQVIVQKVRDAERARQYDEYCRRSRRRPGPPGCGGGRR